MASKIRMNMKKGIWIVSTEVYGVDVICTAGDVRKALRGIQSDIKYIELNLYHAVIRSEES